MMRIRDIIAKKRDGKEITQEEIHFAVGGYVGGSVPDYQMSSLLMAIYLRGMTGRETLALTSEMLESGAVLQSPSAGKQAVDKHSTGGVGDKTSLVIAPVVASAGVAVPMISGRGLGHSGGTLDKLESIPGFRTDLSLEEFKDAVDDVGAALIGQTSEIAPADRKIYALRDVTGTVSSIPLMVASIMSKKLAEGVDALVFDVKVGSGAFIKDETQAVELGTTLIDIARGADKRAVALVTDMNQPLGRMIGNSLELIEAIEILHGRGPADLNLLCRELSAEMIVLGQAAASLEEARLIYDDKISSGSGLEKLREIIRRQGGSELAVDNYRVLPQTEWERTVRAKQRGRIMQIDTEGVGRAAVLLGAGRLRLDSAIDHAVGIRFDVRIGDEVNEGDGIAVIHHNDSSRAEEADVLIQRAIRIADEPAESPDLIKLRLA